MLRTSIGSGVAVLAVALAILLWPGAAPNSQEQMEVTVLNFPELQKVNGRVEIEGPIKAAELAARRDITVAPVAVKDTNQWVEAGVLEADGYTHAVLSVAGTVQGTVTNAGFVGLILVPDQEVPVRALREKGQLLFPIELQTSAGRAGQPYFGSLPTRYPLAFPRYRVFFYNTTDKTVSLDLFAYLTNG